MDTAVLLSRLELRAVGKGVAIFLVATVLIPLVVVIGASFGPRGWIEQVHAVRQFEPVLFIVAGVLAAALVVSRSPILNALVAAVIGALVSLALAVALGASPHLDAGGVALAYLFVPAAWFFVGASCVALAKRGRNAL